MVSCLALCLLPPLLLSKTPGINYTDTFCILIRKKKGIHTKPTARETHPFKEVSDFASAKPWCVGPHRAHEFQTLVRNYLFFWTLAGINHPLGGWCQLRASVTQREYFKHRVTPGTVHPVYLPFLQLSWQALPRSLSSQKGLSVGKAKAVMNVLCPLSLSSSGILFTK